MRIVWKDSGAKDWKSVIKYRNHFVTPYHSKENIRGWVIDIPGDNNVYKSQYCAQNAIDKHLGGHSQKRKPTEKRLSHGIKIVGQRKDNTA